MNDATDVQIRYAAPGEVLYGDHSTQAADLYLLRRGRVRLIRTDSPDGQPRLRGVVGPGEVFGGLESAHGERAVVDRQSELLVLPRNRWGPAEAWLSGMQRRQARLTRTLDLRSEAVLPQRLSELLVLLSERSSEGDWLVAGITQQDLADVLGASRAFVSTALNRLRRAGVLAGTGRTIRIPDRGLLEQAASGGLHDATHSPHAAA